MEDEEGDRAAWGDWGDAEDAGTAREGEAAVLSAAVFSLSIVCVCGMCTGQSVVCESVGVQEHCGLGPYARSSGSYFFFVNRPKA